SRVELLLMTLSGDKDARSAATPFFSHRAYENLRDEGTMAACESAARQGVLSAQVMLAKYHDRYNPDPNAAVYAYRWYTVAGEQISRNCRKLAKSITIEQILEAEELAAEDLSDLTDGITASTEVPVVLKAAPETVQEARPAGNLDRVAKSSA
ncbi:MAG TPA: hypothetical protein VMT53_26605, partial [Terriglobales bacterium]|nr:hypothetical protein [Terriglobales bacterium]